jgi:hypothetical protein
VEIVSTVPETLFGAWKDGSAKQEHVQSAILYQFIVLLNERFEDVCGSVCYTCVFDFLGEKERKRRSEKVE